MKKVVATEFLECKSTAWNGRGNMFVEMMQDFCFIVGLVS